MLPRIVQNWEKQLVTHLAYDSRSSFSYHPFRLLERDSIWNQFHQPNSEDLHRCHPHGHYQDLEHSRLE